MKPEELWERFITDFPHYQNEAYEAWSFGVDPDELAELTAKGIKTATASGYDLYKIEDEPLPQPGEWSIILDGKENAVCVIRTASVSVIPFNKVTEEFAYKEGEGDRSLAYWRRVHIDFFTE